MRITIHRTGEYCIQYIDDSFDVGNHIMENDEKLDSEFRFALDLSEREREQSSTLNTGFDEATATWRVIVRYYGDLYEVERQLPGVQVIPLYHQYGIVRVPQEQLEALAAIPQIQYMEKPKEVYFSLEAGRSASCINLVQGREAQEEQFDGNVGVESGAPVQGSGLTGNGVIVGIADSGIDLTHPAFRRSDGSTRILKLWDQTVQPEAGTDQRGPEHYRHGVEWDQEQINAALQGAQEYGRLPGDTGSAHGTAVAGVAAGNGSGSAGRRYRGIAVDSPIIFVKLASGGEGFSRTTEVMEALDYIVREAQKADMPAAINLSYGNNNGAHDGNSLFEGYITQLAGVWKNVISIASGNEGDSRHHARVKLASEPQRVQFVIGPRESSLSLQLWKQYTDDFSIFLESPDGSRVLVEDTREVRRYELQNASVYVYYGEPTPAQIKQEIYLEWILPENTAGSLPEGIWGLWLIPEKIVGGVVDLWLPSTERIGLSSGFPEPEPDTTLTIPSTADGIIAVGAYDVARDAVASFSGRGDTADGRKAPTLVAPGVGVVTAAPGGGYTTRTGTSIAVPFVTGSVALMMEWGIVQGNDPYLYGEKVKAYLIKGARRLPGQEKVPDKKAGWGALCLSDSLP